MQRVLDETLRNNDICTQSSSEELDSLSQTSVQSVNIFTSLRNKIEAERNPHSSSLSPTIPLSFDDDDDDVNPIHRVDIITVNSSHNNVINNNHQNDHNYDYITDNNDDNNKNNNDDDNETLLLSHDVLQYPNNVKNNDNNSKSNESDDEILNFADNNDGEIEYVKAS